MVNCQSLVFCQSVISSEGIVPIDFKDCKLSRFWTRDPFRLLTTGHWTFMTTEELTTAQLAAVTHVDGPLLILAGPGSGKTRVVTHRIVNLLQQDISGKQILALT